MKLMNLTILNLFILLLSYPFISVENVETEWSQSIGWSGNWHVSNYEFHYEGDNYLVGAINAPGGNIMITLHSNPPTNFNLFNGDRLDLQIAIEGDLLLPTLPQYGSDFHLLLLPIKMNGTSYFELLFDEKHLLENLTQSNYLTSTITSTKAIVALEYRETFNIEYEWDTKTGILVRKVVSDPSGNQFVVLMGEGWKDSENLESNRNFLIGIIITSIIIYWLLKRKQGKLSVPSKMS